MPENEGVVTIEDNDWLYRRITPYNQKQGKISSSAFHPPKETSNNISIAIAKLTSPEECISGHEGSWLARIKAGFVRKLGLEVYHRPINNNPAHGEIMGNLKKHSIRKKLALNAEIIRRST